MHDHKQKMAMKKARRATERPGFTPIRNERIDAAIMARALAIQIADPLTHKADAQQEAIRQVAKTLPMGRMVRRYAPRSSKNNLPDYRGVGGAGPVRQRLQGLDL